MSDRTDRENLDPRPDLPMSTRLREIAHSLDVTWTKAPIVVKDNRLCDLLRALAEEADGHR